MTLADRAPTGEGAGRNTRRRVCSPKPQSAAWWLSVIWFLAVSSAFGAAPVISNLLDRITNEDTATPAISFNVTDEDTGAASLTITAVSDNQALVPNSAIVLGGTGAMRTIQITPALNQNGAANIIVTVSDGQLTASDTFKLTVNPRNDAPTIAPVNDITIDEDTTSPVISILLADVDTDVAKLILTADTPNAAVVLPERMVIGGTGANRTLTLTPEPNRFGTTTVTLFVRDDANGSATEQFNVTVNAVNDLPVVSQIIDQTVNEDRTAVVSFTVRDTESGGALLTTTATANNQTLVPDANIRISAVAGQRALNITPALNQIGTTRITVTVRDPDGGMAQSSFNLTVVEIPDPPTISAIPDQIVAEGTTVGPLTFQLADPDTVLNSLTLTTEVDQPSIVPTANVVLAGTGANRTVTVTPLPDKSGTVRITIKVNDGQAQAQTAFRVTFNTVNSPPQISPINDQSGTGGQPIGPIPFTVTDDETPAANLQVSRSSSNPAVVPDTGLTLGGTSSNRTVTVVPAANASGTSTITLTVSDGQATTTTSFDVTVSTTSQGGTMDFGDAPQDATHNFPTTLAQNGARHASPQRVFLGQSHDEEADGQPSSDALGDDKNPAAADDENGVQFKSPITPGQNANIEVFVTMIGIEFAWLHGWADFNRDGDWSEANEQVFQALPVQPGINQLQFNVPANANQGTSYMRFRITGGNSQPGVAIPPNGLQNDGEVEDYQIEIGSTTGATQDFGDAPDSYKTTLASDGARHTRVEGFNLGKIIDLEADAVPPVNGLGDDASPVAADDEDGAALLGPVTLGQSLSIQVVTTITSGNGKLDVWFDWTRNGTFADVGEKIFTGITVTNGTNNLPAVTVPANAVAGPSYARFRLTRQGINDWFGSAPDGEVEDYAVTIRRATQEEQSDFGDAPQTAQGGYPTRLNRNGARHRLNQGLHLGQTIDLEADGQPNPTATGDDTNGGADEDGILISGPLVPGKTSQVQVEVVAPVGFTVLFYGWVDFNADGDWADAGEKVFDAQPLTIGTHTLSFLVPTTARTGVTFARFRLATQAGLSFDGDGGEGEVEDVRVRVEAEQTDACDLSCTGTDFWIAFPGNYAPDPANPVKPILCVVGPVGSVVTIENLAVNNTTKFTNNTGTLRIELNKLTDLGDVNDAIATKGVHVTATEPIGLYGLSKVTYTSDGFLALPTEVLGTEYVIAGFGNVHSGVPELNGTQFALVAGEANTTVTIIPTVGTATRFAGIPYSITLTNRGDCYQLRSTNDAPDDLTGTIILSDKPVAAFGGHQVANVASADPFYADYVVEQLLPVNRWGMEFYATPLSTRSGGDTFRIIAGHENTSVTINSGTPVLLADKGDFHEVLLASASQITADKPVLVMQYANSSDFDGVVNADPFMVIVPARPHWSASHTFTTPGTGFATHHINVVVPFAASSSLELDGSASAFTSFSTQINGSAYVYATATISTGTHTITCDEPVSVIIYGWNEYESYAWPACLFFGDTTPPIVTCNTKDVVVEAGRDSDNEPCKALVRDYRDSVRATDNCGLPLQTTVQQNPRPGTFLGVGTHQIKLSVRDNVGNVGSCSFNLTVTDPNPNGPITFSCPNDMLVRCTDRTGAIVNYSVTALRGCTPLTEFVQCVPPAGSHFPPGTNEVTCTLKLADGPPRTCTFKVIVNCQRPRTVRINPPTFDPSVPNAPREVVIEFDPESNVVLEVADSITGPWTEVPTTAPRHAIRIAQEKGKFFRLREKTPTP